MITFSISQRRVLVRDQGRAALRVQPRRPAATGRSCTRPRCCRSSTIVLTTELRAPPAAPRHDQPDLRAVGDLHRAWACSIVVVSEIQQAASGKRRPRRRAGCARPPRPRRRACGSPPPDRRRSPHGRSALRSASHEFIEPFRVEPGRKVRLPKDFDPGYTGRLRQEGGRRRAARGAASSCWPSTRSGSPRRTPTALLVIFQAMDAAGKDGTIRHVMSGVNPQGVEVTLVQGAVRAEELDHDYLWRYALRLPGRGDDRHLQPLLLRGGASSSGSTRRSSRASSCRRSAKGKDVWARRFREINDWERYLVDNGTRIVKLFLNVSQGGAEGAVPGPDRRAGAATGSSPPPTSASARTGTTTSGRSRRARATRAPSRRRGTSSRPTASGSCASPRRR